ncbi:MAG TPA: N,N-dimethylformamidase beta subunit family domain-containing protein [Gemmataceae bacterium]|nr:N,N-dimethylformamidase beta subunit family domain-containing protein [Gemmataceae bacterium]
MLVGYVSDESYAALADVALEFRASGTAPVVVRSAPSGAVWADLPPGDCEVCLGKPGFGSKRVRATLGRDPVHFRLLSDRLLGYAWPKWCRGGDSVQFRVHSVEPYKLLLYRYGLKKEFVRNVGWYDNHGPRAVMQTLPDGHFVETGVGWNNGFGVHRQAITAPGRTGLYYFHTRGESGAFFSFPLVVAPAKPQSAVAVLASTNTWNAYNPFGGRSNYILAARMIDEPIVNSLSDLPRYKLSDYGEWKSNADFAPLSFDRPEPHNHVPEGVECTDPIEGRQACHLAPAEWRLLAWLEEQGHTYDVYADYQLHDGTLDLDAYRVLILSVHPEYWSEEMYRAVKRWVFERGGRLMYLGGNGLNCAVEYLDGGTAMRCLNQWPAGYESRFHARVESEANLLGVVFSDAGAMTSAPYQVIAPEHWVFAGTGLRKGDLFGTKTLHERYGDGGSGHETDKISPSSPKNVTLLAKGLNPDDGGAHLVYFETPGGGAVFSAGSITYPSGLLCDPPTARITANVIRRFLGGGGADKA